MIVPATIFSVLRYHSVWYAANLLAAGGFISWAGESNTFLTQFHLLGLLAAIGIHALTSVLVGLLYGAMLPMFPRKPILTAGFIAPLLWTSIIYSALGVISPILNARIDWTWFVISQIAFGLVCGFVANLQVKVRTPQFRALPFVPVSTPINPMAIHRRRETKSNESGASKTQPV
jgi:flagellar biosynthesis protein FliR